MFGTQHLTATKPTQLSTVRGMACWAGGGPEGKTCHDCKFRGYKRFLQEYTGEKGDPFYYYYGCAKFFMLTGKHGPVIDASWQLSGPVNFEGYPPACKYFVDKPARTYKSGVAAENTTLTGGAS